MTSIGEAVSDFLAHKCLAVAGVSRSHNNAANMIYCKLRSLGYKVFAVNPNAATVEGDVCYTKLSAVPEKPDGVVIVTKPEVTEQMVRECAELGIARVWMHQGLDSRATSVSATAVEFCGNSGVNVIPGHCPMMFCKNADFGHRLIRWLSLLTGSLPRQVEGYRLVRCE